MKAITRTVSEFSKTTERLLAEYPINCTAEEMRPFFDVGDDKEMYWCYEITTPEQIAFFRSKGVPITKKANFFVECHVEC